MMEMRPLMKQCVNMYQAHHSALSRTYRTVSGSLNSLTPRCHYSTQSHDTFKQEVPTLPQTAKVVICGGGIIGPSIAYHLSERGWNDIVLLEQGRLTCGTTWHSVGLCGQLRSDLIEMKITRYGRNLYKTFEEEGHGVGWKDSGSISIARTKERMIDYQRKHAIASASGFETHLLTPREIQEKCPMIKTDDLQGGIWIPTDGAVTAPDVAMGFSKLAKTNGAKFMEGVKVEKILTKNDRVSGVETSAGNIDCEYFVNCSGLWSKELGMKSLPNVSLPLHSCEHFYIVTKPLKEVSRLMPVIRDYDGNIYIREWNGGLCIGGFEPNSKPCFHAGVPDRFEFQLLPEDWDHFQVLMDSCLHRLPIMEKAEIRQLVNGPESFTPDSNWLLGETPEIKNYYVAAGMNSRGIICSGGIGKYMTEWIIDGRPSIDLWKYDVRRFTTQHSDNHFLKKRVSEVLGKQYSLCYPQAEPGTGRKLQTTPLHDTLHNCGAVFGQTMACEQPLWFYNNRSQSDTEFYIHKGSFDKPVWFDSVQHEYWACKLSVGIVDVSAQTKLEITSNGMEAVEYLQNLCSNDVNVETDEIVCSPLLNQNGGIETQTAIVRCDQNRFLLTCPATQQTRALSWLRRHLPADSSVQVSDVTSVYSGIKLIGPCAQSLLTNVSNVSTSLSNFPQYTSKVVNISGIQNIRIVRMVHGTEDIFILYIPQQHALKVYQSLLEAGEGLHIQNVGHLVLRHLATENGIGQWGSDFNSYTSPLQCGLSHQVNLSKNNFIGKQAVIELEQNGVHDCLVQFSLEDFNVHTDSWPWGGEPIFKYGTFVGKTSTFAYGFSSEKMQCLGFISNSDKRQDSVNFATDVNRIYEIDIAGERYPAVRVNKSTVESQTVSIHRN